MQKQPWSQFTPDEAAEAKQMHEAGSTIREIAEWLGKPVASVYTMLRQKDKAAPCE